MPKRVSLKERRGEDKKGVNILFESSEPEKFIAPNKASVARAQGSKKATPAQERQEREASPLLKATYYIRPEQDEALDEIKLAVRRKTGEKKDKSELIREAIDLLATQYKIDITGKLVKQ